MYGFVFVRSRVGSNDVRRCNLQGKELQRRIRDELLGFSMVGTVWWKLMEEKRKCVLMCACVSC